MRTRERKKNRSVNWKICLRSHLFVKWMGKIRSSSAATAAECNSNKLHFGFLLILILCCSSMHEIHEIHFLVNRPCLSERWRIFHSQEEKKTINSTQEQSRTLKKEQWRWTRMEEEEREFLFRCCWGFRRFEGFRELNGFQHDADQNKEWTIFGWTGKSVIYKLALYTEDAFSGLLTFRFALSPLIVIVFSAHIAQNEQKKKTRTRTNKLYFAHKIEMENMRKILGIRLGKF